MLHSNGIDNDHDKWYQQLSCHTQTSSCNSHIKCTNKNNNLRNKRIADIHTEQLKCCLIN